MVIRIHHFRSSYSYRELLLFIVTLVITNIATLIRFILNEKEVATSIPPGTTLLDFIRYHKHLVGTKIGCREGDCGACTVLIGELKDSKLVYRSMTSCLVPLGNVQGKHVVTVEGINMVGLNAVQQAMADEGATQCGFCTPGFVMSLAGFCLGDQELSQQNAIAAVDGNICRCTGYKSIERAAGRIAAILKERNKDEDPLLFVSRSKILPEYFSEIKKRLQSLHESWRINHLPDLASLPERPHIIGGGTDLYVQKHDEMVHAPGSFLFDQPALNCIVKNGIKCMIGPSATVTDLKESAVIQEFFPQFHRYAKLVSSTPIRNMATIAGNFINASPIGDFTIFFLALDAQLSLANGKKTRTLPLRKLYKGYKQLDKTPEEYVEQIIIELPGQGHLFNFEKVSKRTNLDIASVNSAISIKINKDKVEAAGISAGGVGPIPLFLEKTSNILIGKKITEELIQDIIETAQAEISPISDVRGSKEYKSLLLGQLIKSHFLTLFPKLNLDKLLHVDPLK